jgi:parallel beta-helix repeat protein
MHMRRTLAAVAAAGLVAACGRDLPPEPPAGGATTAASPQRATIVEPGGSIQAAIDAASPGAVILLRPGLYAQAVHIATPGLTLMGMAGPDGDAVVLQNPGGAAHGVHVASGGDGVEIANLTVRGYDRNGIFIRDVNGFSVRNVTALDNGAYGIYPVLSSNGVIRHSHASGHADAGLYIGQSSDVRMEHNTATANVIGLEVSNSVRVVARHNTAYDNSIGILAILLPPAPFRQFLEASHLVVEHNRVHDNNHPNFAPPGSLPSFVPRGSGILMVGFDDSLVEHNTVTGNDWVGIAVGSTATFGQLAGIPIVGIEPDPDRVVVRHNLVLGNGNAPPVPPFPLPGVDLLWDLTGSGNCWAQNAHATAFPSSLPSCR